MEVYGTTWQGHELWNYEIVFDSEYSCIVGGKVTMGSDEDSIYGEELNYCNAALIQIIKSRVEENTNLQATNDERNDQIDAGLRSIDNDVNDDNSSEEVNVDGNYSNEEVLINNADGNSEIVSTERDSDSNDTLQNTNAESNEESTEELTLVSNIRGIIGEFKSRLRDEGATHRTLALISQISMGAIHPSLDIIDYNDRSIASGRDGGFNVM